MPIWSTQPDCLQRNVLMNSNMPFYRNSPAVNRFFRLEAPLMNDSEVVADPRYLARDESYGMASLLDDHRVPRFHAKFMATLSPWRYAFAWDENRFVTLRWHVSKVVEIAFALFYSMKRRMKSAAFPVDASLRRFAT